MVPTRKTQTLKTIVFLSHDSRDRPRIYVLRDRLRGYGFDVWMDSEGISPGEKWEEQIQKALTASHAVLVS
ncbi:MAG: toll/interleukin-1 receptor domain-containing protein [Bryobacteraceae bacterium]